MVGLIEYYSLRARSSAATTRGPRRARLRSGVRAERPVVMCEGHTTRVSAVIGIREGIDRRRTLDGETDPARPFWQNPARRWHHTLTNVPGYNAASRREMAAPEEPIAITT